MEDTITIDDFKKLDLRIGEVVSAVEVPESNKLLKLTVDFGPLGERTVFSGIKKWYLPSDLEGKNFVFLFNLAPRAMMGEESQGMLLAAEDDEEKECVLLIPEKGIEKGSKIN